MSDVFNEIDDDLRAEQLKKFWKENGSWIIGGAIAAVLLTGVMTFWRQWEYQRNAKATTELVQLIKTTDMSKDMSKLETFGNDTDKNHAMIARFMAAGAHLERGEKEKALALYNTIADTSGLDQTWRDLARLLGLSLRLDKDKPETLEKELSKLSDEKSPWRYTAGEMQALLAAKNGRAQHAVDILTKISADPLAPAEARARAVTLRDLYLADIKPVDAKKTDPKT